MAKKFAPGGFRLRVGRSKTGLGLFAEEPIRKGACVIEYKGRVLSPKEEEESNSLYLFEVSKTKTIDGASRANKARYINHSCRPNCEIDIYRGRVYVMSKRTIKAGEELSYDYDTEYFNEYIKPKGCRCDACLSKKSDATPKRQYKTERRGIKKVPSLQRGQTRPSSSV